MMLLDSTTLNKNIGSSNNVDTSLNYTNYRKSQVAKNQEGNQPFTANSKLMKVLNPVFIQWL